MTEHTHYWKRDNARTHKRPPRYFVTCDCGEKAQAVMIHGYQHVFKTGRKLDGYFVKRVCSVRLSEADKDAVKSGRLRLVIVDKRITLAV
jgi:hypothetical protein